MLGNDTHGQSETSLDMEVLPTVSVIIPTRNRSELVLKVVSDLKQQEYPKEKMEIIIVDQSDIFEPQLFVGEKNVKHLRVERKGLPFARNKGAMASSGTILVFLDDDVRITTPQAIKAHVMNYHDPAVGAVAGRVLQSFDKPVTRLKPKHIGRIITSPLLIVTANFNWHVKQYVEGVPGGNFSVRREVFFSVGGFDTRFIGTAYFEETDFSLRVRQAGYRIIFEPLAEVRHLRWNSGGCRDHAKRREQAFYWYFHNYVYLFWKHGAKHYAPLFLGYLLARGVAYIFKYRSIRMFTYACLKGILDGFRYTWRCHRGDVERSNR